ncbi:hypothetical protein [Mesoterricola silvestris]|uniref:Uncharacterized protein n=1 Tax=Mesoterricola silvestris TaxID=2927979 RepID=A0AA48GQZ2_9BACT|nr:hypothetical protein [Mesoterricola silvestris]BDU72407.1 hypothetical protein METEAL_15810 [Mesoterricola silvestris]
MALWGLLTWLIAEVVVFLPLYLLGVVFMWPLLKWAPKRLKESNINRGQFVYGFLWPWLDELFGNREDGLLPEWWALREGTAYGWFLRNPICNMRFWPLVSTLPKPTVKWIGNAACVPPSGVPGWFLAWQGGYVGFLWQCRSWGLWAGWKLNPRDATFILPDDYRTHGLGTACQLMRF